MRIGHGFDAHRFGDAQGDATVILGGVKISHTKSLLAHSDGDVVLHALCDALLGAAALGDIGKHFPDTNDEYKGISSRKLLVQVCSTIKQHQLTIGNIDITIVAQSPKMAPHIDAMKNNIAEDTQLPLQNINIKATTTEGMGFTGRGEGIAVHVVTLLKDSQ